MTDERAGDMKSGAPTAEDLATIMTVADLARCMRQLHQADGKTSLRELESWGMGHARPMPKSTLSDAFTGKQRPSAELLESFLKAMGVRDDATVRRLWLEALDRIPPAQPGRLPRSYADRGLGPVPAHTFFVEMDKVDEIYRSIEQAQEQVWLLGTTLSRHVPYLESAFQQAISNGCNIRIVLIKPAGAAMDMSVLRAGPDGLGRHEQEERLGTNLAILRRLATVGPSLEVRLIDYLAPYTLYAYDPGLAAGMIEMRLGSFHGEHHLRPTFQVRRTHDEAWFQYFYEQFVLTWNAADPYELSGGTPDQ